MNRYDWLDAAPFIGMFAALVIAGCVVAYVVKMKPEPICVAGYLHIRDENGSTRQLLDSNGHGIQCGVML